MNKTFLQIFIENLVLTMLSIVKVLILSYKSNLKKRNSSNEHCIILGNGPSLTDSMSRLGNFVEKTQLFCVNHVALKIFIPLLSA